MNKWMIAICLLLFVGLMGCGQKEQGSLGQESGAVSPKASSSEPDAPAPLISRGEEENSPEEPVVEALPAVVEEPSADPGADYSPAEGFAVYPLSEEQKQLLTGNSWQPDGPVTLEDLCYLTVLHRDFEGAVQQGELVIHHSVANEVADIFLELYQAEYPIHRISLIEAFNGDDNASMEANNTSGFNMRSIAGTQRWSYHSYGVAVDINPLQNPYVTVSGVWPSKEYLERQNTRPGMITEGDPCYEAFVSRGWSWGGYWADPDYQHFEKPLKAEQDAG